MSTLIHGTRPRIPARVYAGNWIVDCPRCRWAGVLPFGEEAVGCPECELFIEVVWPTEQFAAGVARLLDMRPIIYTRNWLPHETLHDLAMENVEHGVFTPMIETSINSNMKLIIGDGGIRTDNLPTIERSLHRALGA